MTEDKGIIKQVDLDSAKDIRVEVSEYKGTTYIGVREWWTPEGQEPARTKKGVNVRLDDALILTQTILDAYNEATGGSWELRESE